ncbi:MAG: ATP synthase F1 subunit epsilon [Rhodospirillales bacterium]|nr:ATP synthase F1 subunit epsilon [Rhodospirillales bacterium]MCB9979786.1 ATP synthase F1 subunit epsilon [Rhodospirillales bacterium]
MNTFQFELVSPEKKLMSEPATYALIPGEEGECGILPGHAALMTSLKPGVVKVRSANDNSITQEIFIAGGFADVTAESVTVLAEEAVPVSSLDRAALESQMSILREDLKLAVGVADQHRLQAQIVVVNAKLAAARA